LKVTFPPELEFLSEPHRYKVLYGGRGGIKSWSVAQHLLIAGVERPLRIPCARETMQSIRESVHQLLEDTRFQDAPPYHLPDRLPTIATDPIYQLIPSKMNLPRFTF
jgi:hypothetical protein